jgi:Protein of unknown function (DUF1350)
MDWQEISGNWVLVPPRPVAIVHFLGGAFIAAAPHVTYRRLLEFLATHGHAIIATPFINTFDHLEIAESVLASFEAAREIVQTRIIQKRYLPIYGIGHSMGCKLHLLIGSRHPVERAGNVLMAFNNYAAREAVPLVEQFSQMAPAFTVEFTPDPAATNRLIEHHYQVRRNLLVKFSNDTIDQTRLLSTLLEARFPNMVTIKKLSGNHLTPLGQDMKWDVGAVFTPFDAIGQWVRQEVFKELSQLEQAILLWLNPMAKR